MFVSRKDFDELKNKVEEQDKLINHLIYQVNEMKRKEKETAYLG